jgi:hypothetical protein
MTESENTDTDDSEVPLLFSVKRTRRELGDVSERQVYKLIELGLLDRRKVRRSTKITSASVRRLAGSK